MPKGNVQAGLIGSLNSHCFYPEIILKDDAGRPLFHDDLL
jgi:hypothetical protein